MPEIFLGEFSTDAAPPVLSNKFPVSGATEQPLNTSVSFDLVDVGSGVYTSSVFVTLNGIPAISAGVYQPGFTGAFAPIVDGYSVTVNPSTDFVLHDTVTVLVYASDLNPLPNAMAPVSWSFDTLDDSSEPTVANNAPSGQGYLNGGFPFAAHVTFDLLDSGFNGVGLNSVVVTVDGTVAYRSSGALNGFIVVVTTVLNGYHFDITPPAPWTPAQTVDIDVSAQDTYATPHVMSLFSWSFLALVDATPPHVENNAPVGLYRPVAEHITLDIVDATVVPLVPASVVIRVDGLPVWQNELAQAGFTAVVTAIVNGLHYDITAPYDWVPGANVTVTVDAADAVNTMTPFSWSFVGTITGLERCAPADLLPVEARLREPFTKPSLETLRKAVLTKISRDSMLDHRIRGVLLTAHFNDFKPVFADVLPVPAAILAELVCRRRKLFDLYADLLPYVTTMHAATEELRTLGLSQGYIELIHARVDAPSPQQVVDAACAILLFGSILQPG